MAEDFFAILHLYMTIMESEVAPQILHKVHLPQKLATIATFRRAFTSVRKSHDSHNGLSALVSDKEVVDFEELK